LNRAFLVCIASAFLTAPLALAHEPAGTPKNYCEPTAEWSLHDYGVGATGTFSFTPVDGNAGGDCDEVFHVPNDPIIVCVDATPSLVHMHWCDPDFSLPAGDPDYHAEYATGGGYIFTENGEGAPSAGPNVGAGTEYCYGAWAHHAYFGPVFVYDTVGSNIQFDVGVDLWDAFGVGDGCGDGFVDLSTGCAGTCTVTFGPGLDGAYYVYATGTVGHIYWQ
jgi:hypothetical protein